MRKRKHNWIQIQYVKRESIALAKDKGNFGINISMNITSCMIQWLYIYIHI